MPTRLEALIHSRAMHAPALHGSTPYACGRPACVACGAWCSVQSQELRAQRPDRIAPESINYGAGVPSFTSTFDRQVASWWHDGGMVMAWWWRYRR